MTVLTTVVSRPAPERAIIDAGRKTLNIEIHPPAVWPDARTCAWCGSRPSMASWNWAAAQGLKIGDRVELIPGYGDLTTMLHDEMYGFRGGKLEVIWPIACARETALTP